MYHNLTQLRTKISNRENFFGYDGPIEDIKPMKVIKVVIPNHQKPSKRTAGMYNFFRSIMP